MLLGKYRSDRRGSRPASSQEPGIVDTQRDRSRYCRIVSQGLHVGVGIGPLMSFHLSGFLEEKVVTSA